MKKYLQKGVVMVAGVVGIPALISHADNQFSKPECKLSDRRFQLLKRFLHNAQSPIEPLSPAFIQEADANHLDWRLLPSLSLIESGAGRTFQGNNVFGWNNGQSSFKSVRDCIHFVADRLAHSRNYKGKSIAEKLSSYNSDAEYGQRVRVVMARISGSKIPQ